MDLEFRKMTWLSSGPTARSTKAQGNALGLTDVAEFGALNGRSNCVHPRLGRSFRVRCFLCDPCPRALLGYLWADLRLSILPVSTEPPLDAWRQPKLAEVAGSLEAKLNGACHGNKIGRNSAAARFFLSDIRDFPSGIHFLVPSTPFLPPQHRQSEMPV